MKTFLTVHADSDNNVQRLSLAPNEYRKREVKTWAEEEKNNDEIIFSINSNMDMKSRLKFWGLLFLYYYFSE